MGHHPFYFDLDGTVYVGMGHSSNGIMADWFKLVNGSWVELDNFASYKDGQLVTSEARVAGTQGSIADCKLGYVLSGDGDNHDFILANFTFTMKMNGGNFHRIQATHAGHPVASLSGRRFSLQVVTIERLGKSSTIY